MTLSTINITILYLLEFVNNIMLVPEGKKEEITAAIFVFQNDIN